MSKTIARYHVLHRSGYVGEDAPTEQLLPPAIHSAAGECPAHGECSICWTASKCPKLAGLVTAEANGELLLPGTFRSSTGHHRPGQARQDYDDDGLYPAGVS